MAVHLLKESITKEVMMSDNCTYTQAEYQIYSVAMASLLWCGVAEKNVDYELSKCVSTGSDSMSKAILRHPTIKCLEPRMRAIFLAIDAEIIPCTRENGRPIDEYVAYGRRHVYGKDLKNWAKTLPNDEQPRFLMTPQELEPRISHEVYLRLKAEYDVLNAEKVRAENKLRDNEYKDRATTLQIEAINKQLAEAQAKTTEASQTDLNNLKMTVKAFIDYMANSNTAYKYGNKPNISKIDLAICGTVHVADSTIKDVLDMCKDFEK